MKATWPARNCERAAGVILFRRAGAKVEFLLLRNARHRTWGFAKGRAEADEEPIETARREVCEETGIDRFSTIDGFTESIEYSVRSDRGTRHTKIVMYFLAETDAKVVTSDEHDDVAWLTADAARSLIQHDNLRAVLDAADSAIRKQG